MAQKNLSPAKQNAMAPPALETHRHSPAAPFLSPQFLRFLAFGGLAALINLAAGKLLYDHLLPSFPYWISVWIAASLGLAVNFLCNYSFNFTQHVRSMSAHFRSFFIAAIGGTALTALLSRSFFSLFHHWGLGGFSAFGFYATEKFLAHFTAVGMVVFYSYWIHKHISFGVGFRGKFAQLRQQAGPFALSRQKPAFRKGKGQ
jgi:putative flippase GtrA